MKELGVIDTPPCRIALAAIATILLGALSTPVRAEAQTVPDDIKKRISAACQNTVSVAIAQLRPHLGEHAELRDKTNLVLVMPVANFNAFADYKERRILIPLMLCVETWYLLDAIHQMYRHPSLREKTQQYINYLSRRQRDSLARGTGFDTVPIQPFHEFAGVAYPKLSDEETNRSLAARESMMVESVAFILGHEIGHLALHHKPYTAITPETARKQESEADEFSARLLRKAGISMLAAIPMIQRFLENERLFKRIAGGAMTHPRPECRMERIISSTGELEELLKNPDRRRDYEQGSGLSAADFSKTMGMLREDCQRSPLGGTPLARLIESRKDRFASIRGPRGERIDGERNWDAILSLNGISACTVWEGSTDIEPRVSCPMGRTKDDAHAKRIFSEALETVQSTIPSDWKRKEREYTRTSRMKIVDYFGFNVKVRVSMTSFESSGSHDVRVSVYAIN